MVVDEVPVLGLVRPGAGRCRSTALEMRPVIGRLIIVIEGNIDQYLFAPSLLFHYIQCDFLIRIVEFSSFSSNYIHQIHLSRGRPTSDC